MYQERREIIEDEIVIDVGELVHKATMVLKHSWYIILALFLVGTAASFGAMLYMNKPEYQAYVTYQITLSGDDAADAVAAGMLGSQMTSVFETSGLKEQLTAVLGEETEWLDENCLIPEYSSSMNLLTIQVSTDAAEHTQNLLEAVKKVMPDYAADQLENVLLLLMDENLNLREPVRTFGKVKMAAIGVFAGCLLAGLYVLLSVLENRLVYSREDMKQISGLDCLGELPAVKKTSGKNIPVSLSRVTKHNRRYAEQMRSLRHKVENALRDQGGNVLLVTSSVSGEGKTTISSNLAMTLARNEKKVILVDTDLYRAGAADQLKPAAISGTLQDYLKGKCSCQSVITKGLPMDVIYGKAEEKTDGILLAGERMVELIRQLKQEYDYVIIDTAPTVLRSDADLLTRLADAVLFVVGYGAVTRTTAEKGLQYVIGDHIHAIGYVLNGSDAAVSKYSGAYYS